VELDDPNKLRQNGEGARAEAECEQLLNQHPTDAALWHRWGILAHLNGRTEVAVARLRRAIAISPMKGEYDCDLGALLGAVGLVPQAIACLGRAVALRGDLPEVHYNLGAALERLGRLDEAARAYRNAIAIRADYAQAHNGLRNALRRINEERGSGTPGAV